MNFLKLITENKLDEAKQKLFEKLELKIVEKLIELKKDIVDMTYNLDEAVKRNPNIVKMGRITRIRRRIRRNAKGQIVIQRNRKRSNIKGYRIQGSSIRRISAIDRLRKARLLRRSWRTTRKGKLRRSLMKRTMSMRRRQSMGIR